MATQPTTKSDSISIKAFILASLGVSLLGLVFGFVLAAIFFTTDSTNTGSPPNKSVELLSKPIESKSKNALADSGNEVGTSAEIPVRLSMTPLVPIITNLNDQTNVWVRLEGSILFDENKTESAPIMAHKLSQHLLAYLRTIKLSELQGNSALHAISQDMNEIATSLSDGQATGILITSLVFE